MSYRRKIVKQYGGMVSIFMLLDQLAFGYYPKRDQTREQEVAMFHVPRLLGH